NCTVTQPSSLAVDSSSAERL
ncbi:unnamed protein product, partial [Rotaria sp. Silwood2]